MKKEQKVSKLKNILHYRGKGSINSVGGVEREKMYS